MKPIFFYILLSFYSNISFAQTDSVPAKASLTLGTVYANNASYYGQKSAESTPYIALAATYKLKCGFYFSALSYKLLNDKISGVSASSIGAGFNFKLAPNVTTDINYSHSFYSKYSPMLQASNADNASISFTRSGWINVTIAGDYAFGTTNDGFVTGGLSKSINLFSIGTKDIVTLTPSADIVAGTQHFYENYVKEQKLRDNVLGIITGPFTGDTPQSNTTTVAKTSFNLLSYNLKLPLAYNRAHYVIEAAYQLSILSSEARTGAGNKNSFATLSFYYQF